MITNDLFVWINQRSHGNNYISKNEKKQMSKSNEK